MINAPAKLISSWTKTNTIDAALLGLCFGIALGASISIPLSWVFFRTASPWVFSQTAPVGPEVITLNVDPECNSGWDWEWKSLNREPTESQVLTCLDGQLKSSD